MLESKRRALDKYNNKCKAILLKYNTDKEEDQKVIKKLESVPSKSDYVRQLILKDIKED